MNNHVHGGDVYHYRDCLDFSANCNPLGTPESVKAAARDSLERIYEYRTGRLSAFERGNRKI